MNSILIIFVISSVAIVGSSAQCAGSGTFCVGTEFCESATFRICQARDQAPLGPIPCPTGQYCRTTNLTTSAGSCQPDVANTCMAAAGFSCSGEGVFPNPTDCTSFYTCTENEIGDIVAERKTCNPGYVFHGLYADYCAPRVGTLNCITLTCPTTGGTQYIKFGNSFRYYALCSPLLPAPIMYRCPERNTFDATTRVCVFACPGYGNFPNSDDPRKYYTCTVVRGVLRATENTCGIRQFYDVSSRNCRRSL
ncbi:unnamed protein product [Diamesa tonsa]